jgi:hypothetical protein
MSMDDTGWRGIVETCWDEISSVRADLVDRLSNCGSSILNRIAFRWLTACEEDRGFTTETTAFPTYRAC